MHGVQPSPKTMPSSGAPASPVAGQPVDPQVAGQPGQPAEEGQPEQDHDDAEHPLERALVLHQQRAQPAEEHPVRDEDRGEAEHEQHRADHHPGPRRRLGEHRGPAAPGGAIALRPGRGGIHTGQAGDVGQVARDQRQHARREEADQPDQRGDQGGHQQRAVGDDVGEGLAGAGRERHRSAASRVTTGSMSSRTSTGR